MRKQIVVALVAALMAAGTVAAVAVPVPNPDPCQAVYASNTIANLQKYEKCRLDRIEAAIPGNQTVTVTPAPVTVTAPPVTVTVTAAPTSPTDPTTTAPEPTTTPPTTAPPTLAGFPTAATTGVPAGWQPKETRGSFTVTTAGAVIEDIRVNGDIDINAPNVTLRRVEINGGKIENWPGAVCHSGTLIENVTINRATSNQGSESAISTGGYTIRNTKINGTAEGIRVGAKSVCGPVVVENSWIQIKPPDVCGDWHGDGIQGYDGPKLTVRNTVIDMIETAGCGGTAPFFYPNQGNTSVDVDGLIVKGGGYSFRLDAPGVVKNLHVVNNSWGYGPLDVNCGKVTEWTANVSTLGADGQPTVVRALPCG